MKTDFNYSISFSCYSLWISIDEKVKSLLLLSVGSILTATQKIILFGDTYTVFISFLFLLELSMQLDQLYFSHQFLQSKSNLSYQFIIESLID
ncbi:unnamed protein product [Paramecium sonneborni]|uniref:Uncharacterized protein n=1 Tax=Paramecium sonneborni TaxID=65129 RepID=A0A8S1NX78_9CILI|nr:unnamed protein product [Paramecium sonneborni]